MIIYLIFLSIVPVPLTVLKELYQEAVQEFPQFL